MPQQYVLWDLEFTLFCYLHSYSCSDKLPHYLTKVTIKGYEQYVFHMIHKEITAQIFKAMLDKGVNIGFITASQFSPQLIKNFLAEQYEISSEILDTWLYICATDFGDRHTAKGKKIKAAQATGLIPQDARITLIDDDEVHIANAHSLGYSTILAQGQPDPRSNDGKLLVGNDRYLHQIIKAFALNIIKDTKQQLLFSADAISRPRIASSTSTADTSLSQSPTIRMPLVADSLPFAAILEGNEQDDECCTWPPRFMQRICS